MRWLLLTAALLASACGPKAKPATFPVSQPYPTWRCVLQTKDGTRNLAIVELPPPLRPHLVLTGCNDGLLTIAQVARLPCSAGEQRPRIFRFYGLEVDTMTATYRNVAR